MPAAPKASDAPVAPVEKQLTKFLVEAGVSSSMIALTQQALEEEGVESVEDLKILVAECGIPASIKTIPKIKIEKALQEGSEEKI